MKKLLGLSIALLSVSGCVFNAPSAPPEELSKYDNDWLCYVNRYSTDEQIEKIRAEFIRRGVKSYWMRSPQAVGPDVRYYCPGIDE